MAAVLLVLAFLRFQDEPSAFQPKVYVLHGVESPVGLVRAGDKMWLVSDLGEPRPGIYRLLFDEATGVARVGLSHYEPLEDYSGMALGEDGRMFVLSRRTFTTYPEDWQQRVYVYGARNLDLLDQFTLGEHDATCSDGTEACGFTGGVFEDDIWWMLDSPGRFLWFRPSPGGLSEIGRAALRFGGLGAEIADVVEKDGSFYFLVKNRWMIAKAEPGQIKAAANRSLVLEPFLSMKSLKRQLKIEDHGIFMHGLATAFCFDEKGRVWVLFSPMGSRFREGKDEDAGFARLVIFEPSTPNH